MTMAFKYQVLLCPRPKDILLISFNHMDAIRDFVKDAPSILNQVDETYQQLIEVWSMWKTPQCQTDVHNVLNVLHGGWLTNELRINLTKMYFKS